MAKKKTSSAVKNKKGEARKTATTTASPHLDAAAMVKQAIAQNVSLKTQFPNIIDMLLGSVHTNGHHFFCVDIHLNDNNTEGFPTLLSVNFKGSMHSVPVKLLPQVGLGKSTAANGDTIINQSINSMIGTLGCVVTDAAKQNRYALSCCHVFTDDVWNPSLNGTNVPAGQVIYDNTSAEQLGNWTFGIMNDSFDIGLAAIDDPSTVAPSNFGAARDADFMDVLNKTAVIFKGATTPLAEAFIANVECTKSVAYGAQVVQIQNLILISTANNTAPSQGGDSGSLVYTADASRSPIGLLIAADTTFSYVIPLLSILSATGTTIY